MNHAYTLNRTHRVPLNHHIALGKAARVLVLLLLLTSGRPFAAVAATAAPELKHGVYPMAFLIPVGNTDALKKFKFIITIANDKAGHKSITVNTFKKATQKEITDDTSLYPLQWTWAGNAHHRFGAPVQTSSDIVDEITRATLSAQPNPKLMKLTPDEEIQTEAAQKDENAENAKEASAIADYTLRLAKTLENNVAQNKEEMPSKGGKVIACISSFGVVGDVADIKCIPINVGNGQPTSQADIDEADTWVVANCAANISDDGQAIFGIGQVRRSLTPIPGTNPPAYTLHYSTFYLGLTKEAQAVSVSLGGSAVSSDVDVDLDYGLIKHVEKNIEGLPGLSWLAGPVGWVNPSLPTFSVDKKTGLSQATSLVLGQPSGWVTFPVSGSNSFMGDFYKVSVGPSFQLDPKGDQTLKLNSDFQRSQSPQGSLLKQETVGEVTLGDKISLGADKDHPSPDGIIPVYAPDQIVYALNGKYDAVDAGTDVTNDLSMTLFNQESFYIPNGEVDLNTWSKPSNSTEHDNFYSDEVGRVHVGGDIPVNCPESNYPQFFRLDETLTGGGNFGVVPGYAKFNGGSNYGEGQSSATVPSPVVRSIGDSQLQVNPTKGMPAGATSFANYNFTMAIPIWCSLPLLDPGSRTQFEKTCDAALTTPWEPSATTPHLDDADDDTIAFDSHYMNLLSLKPLIAFDAAWLGAPAGFHDRSVASVGGGGEVSVLGLNLDFLYSQTVADSSHATKTGNWTVQTSYDIHF